MMDVNVNLPNDSQIKLISTIKKISAVVACAPFLLIALICIAGGTFCIAWPLSLEKRCTETVDAVVIDFDEGVMGMTAKDGQGFKQNKDVTTYDPIFSFTLNGTHYTQKAKIGSNEKAFETGENIVLKVNPDDPSEVFAPGDKSYLKTGLGFYGVAGLLIAICVVVYLKTFKGVKFGGLKVKIGKNKF